jgi:predicted acetyltransferase
MDLRYRTIEAGEYDRWMYAHESTFHGAPAQDEIDLTRDGIEFDRVLAAFDGEQMVAGAAAASFKMTVPGGAKVPTAGVTGVGVMATHRRRGVNTQLMRLQLDDFHERGEPLAALFASEGNIYGRFGYGLAVMEATFQIEAIRAGYSGEHANSGSVTLMDLDGALPVLQEIYQAATDLRPGMMTADPCWLRWRMTRIESDGPEPWFYAVHSRDGIPDGFAVYNVKQEWAEFTPGSELTVRELHGLSPEATSDLWRFIFDMDLIRTVKALKRPIDEPLLLQLAEPRRLRLTVFDALYVRLVDVAGALAARSYSSDGRLVIQVHDSFCSWNDGCYALESAGGTVTCTRTDHDPDLECDARDLGAVYLGGTSWRQLRRAVRGREHTEGALALADRMFASDPAPWCSFMF